MTLHDWVPIALYLIVAFMIPFGMVMLGVRFGAKARRPDVRGQKHIAFESGVSTGFLGRQRFPIDFYLTAMLFIIFDIELVFLYPLGVILGKLGNYGLVELGIFVVILLAAYVYVWARGALEWE